MSNEIGNFRRELRSCVGRPVAYQIRDGVGAALVPLLEKVITGARVHDGDLYSAIVAEEQTASAQRREVAQRLSTPSIIPAGKGGKATALVSMRGMALYDVEYQPMAFSTFLLAQTVTALGNDPEIGMVVLMIDTPGGVVTGVKEAADAIYSARQKKPVVAIVNPLCASAGYWLASQATEIVSVPSGDIGSVGVFILHADCSGMLEEAGINHTFIFAKESPYKVDGNMYQPLSESAREEFQTGVDETMNDFVKAIARGRGVSAKKVLDDFGKGRTLDAAKAKSVGMIDRIATINVAFARLGLHSNASQSRRRGESIQFSTEGAGDERKVYVDHDWPQTIEVTTAMIKEADDHLKVDGDEITFECENGIATYRKIEETETGDWFCELVDGAYEERKAPADGGDLAAGLTTFGDGSPEAYVPMPDGSGDDQAPEPEEAEHRPTTAAARKSAREREIFLLEHS